MSLVYRAVILGQMGLTPDPDPVNTVNVAPGVSSAFINGLPAGTLIQFANGTYQGLSLLPKAGQIFRGNPANPAAVVLQGTGNFRAFHGGSGNAPDVTISGLTITGYQSGMGSQFVSRPTGQAEDAKAQIGALEDACPNWVIADCRLVANYCTALRMGNGTRVSRCTISDNGHVGILVGRETNVNRARDTVIEDTTIAGNCRFNMNKTWDSGGIKYVGGATPGGLNPALNPARNNIVRRCLITANNGPGIWWDWDVFDGEIHHCSIFANHASGIVIEASATAHIHHNQIGDNCTGSLPALISFRCCALGVQNSKKCVIEHNLFVITRENSMAMTQHNRATGTVNTPKGGVYTGWFTATENRWQRQRLPAARERPVRPAVPHPQLLESQPRLHRHVLLLHVRHLADRLQHHQHALRPDPRRQLPLLHPATHRQPPQRLAGQHLPHRLRLAGAVAVRDGRHGAPQPRELRPELATAPDLDHAAGQDLSLRGSHDPAILAGA